MSLKKVFMYLYWFIAYLPLISLMLFKYSISSPAVGSPLNDLRCQFGILFLIIIFNIVLYKLLAHIFVIEMEKKVIEEQTKLFVRKYSEVSINDYSFFILSLVLPFVTGNTSSVFDLIIIIGLIWIIIYILVKKKQMIICPIFLFSKNNVFNAEIEIDGFRKEAVYIITKESDLNFDGHFYYYEYFKNIFYLKRVDNGL